MPKKCNGEGILWLKPGDSQTLVICPGCKICRDTEAQALKNSKPFTKREIEALKSGGFTGADLRVTLRKLMRCKRKANSNYVNFLKSCLNVDDIAKMLALSKDEVINRLEGNPPRLLGLKFQSHWLLPSNQFHQDQLVSNFEKVLAVCYQPTEHTLNISSWFGLADIDLQVEDKVLSPREWLIRNLPLKRILRIAENLGIGL